MTSNGGCHHGRTPRIITTMRTGVQMIVQQPAITVAWLTRSLSRVGAIRRTSFLPVFGGNLSTASKISCFLDGLRRCTPLTKDHPSESSAANRNRIQSGESTGLVCNYEAVAVPVSD
jgi:hypothetical protein